MVPWTGSEPRRARHLIPTALPHRGQVLALCAVAILLAHLLLAQLTLVLAIVFAVVTRASRWRLWWLLAPALTGLVWTLAIGPDKALAGFAAGPWSILWHLGGGHLAGEAGHPFAGFAGAQAWLPRQFPVALIAGAAEAALAGWLSWLRTDEWAVPPPRPGLVAAARRRFTARAIRAGAVVTRDGCALGVMPSTGATAGLRWADLAQGALVAGAAPHDVTLAGLQIVHAALRRRKPVIVLDPGDASIARAVAAACQATGAPLLGNGAGTGAPATPAAGASQLWGRGGAQPASQPAGEAPVDLGRVVRERLAALLPADSAELAGRACAGLSSLAADLRRIGADGDALVWVPRGECAPAQALSALLANTHGSGVSVLIAAASPQAAAELSERAGTLLTFRVADPELAARLAARTGTRLLPAAVAAALASRPHAGPWPSTTAGAPPAGAPPAGAPPAGAPPAGAPPAGAVAVAPAPDLFASPVVPAPALQALGPGEFVLAVSALRPRPITFGRLIPARLGPYREKAAR